MNEQIKYYQVGNTINVELPTRFTFDYFTTFKLIYSKYDKNSEYIFDGKNMMHIDTSGLGMILFMVDYIGEENKKNIKFINCNHKKVKSVLELSRFTEMFEVE